VPDGSRPPSAVTYGIFRLTEFLAEYGLFLAKSLTVLAVVLVIVAAAAGAAARGRRPGEEGHVTVRRLNARLEGMRDALRAAVLDNAALRKLRKSEKREEKRRRKGSGDTPRRRVFVLRFDGDLQATGVTALRNEVTAVLTLAEEGDEVVACIESAGGTVHGYGLAASQLLRVRSRDGVSLTAAVDKVAASGGYLMACIAPRILAAPFAILGSIGVVAQVPNVHRLLKRNDIDVEVLTAGEYKRTLTIFGENTEKGRAKFLSELEDVHGLFKDFVREHRPTLDVDVVGTGETWYGRHALEHGLCDELLTSDEYLVRACEDADVFEVRWVEHRTPVDRFLHRAASAFAEAGERVLARLGDPRDWTR
jgi:serine protease SohB